MPETEEIKAISPLFSQKALRMLGAGLSTYNGSDIYFYIEAVYVLLYDLGEDYVKEEWEKIKGKNWEKTKKNIERLNKKANEVIVWYNALNDKKFEKKDKELAIKKHYLKTASKIPVLLPEFFELMVFLIKKTPLHRQTIPSEAFKIIEHHGRKPLGAKDKKPVQTQTTEVSQESD